jgi:hypothetical protein
LVTVCTALLAVAVTPEVWAADAQARDLRLAMADGVELGGRGRSSRASPLPDR